MTAVSYRTPAFMDAPGRMHLGVAHWTDTVTQLSQKTLDAIDSVSFPRGRSRQSFRVKRQSLA